eukprot:3062431-Prymnesium_polylepis.1
MADVRQLKRRAGVAEEAVRIKKEQLDEAAQEYEEEHRTFTAFSKQLEEKWEQRFDALARLACAFGVPPEDIECVRKQPWTDAAAASERDVLADRNVAAALKHIAAQAEAEKQALLQQTGAQAEKEKLAALQQAEARAQAE